MRVEDQVPNRRQGDHGLAQSYIQKKCGYRMRLDVIDAVALVFMWFEFQIWSPPQSLPFMYLVPYGAVLPAPVVANAQSLEQNCMSMWIRQISLLSFQSWNSQSVLMGILPFRLSCSLLFSRISMSSIF